MPALSTQLSEARLQTSNRARSSGFLARLQGNSSSAPSQSGIFCILESYTRDTVSLMRERREKLGDAAAVKGTVVQAHLMWADGKLAEARACLEPLIHAECARLITHSVLATDWIPFRCLIAIDRAIARAVSGIPNLIYYELGRHSATLNLGGAYRSFVAEEPHRFFEQMTLLHSRFCNFGRSVYEREGDRSGQIRTEGYEEYSPVFCASGLGYYEGALDMMKVPGPIAGVETACQCAGDPACVYKLSW
jgi:hypothetical protein